jgi:acetolactate synthase-1/2/3 large subunit
VCSAITRRDSPLRAHRQEADVVLAVGSRLALVTFKPGTRIVQIDADEREIGRNHKDTLGLVGDARATLEALLERLRAGSGPRPSRKAEHEALRARIAADDTMEPNASILRALRAETPEHAILVAGMTQIGYYSRPFWPVYEPRTYLTSSYSGNLGYAYPVALGAKVARPDRPVISVSGDGGFLFNAQELATAVSHRINVVAVVFNDSSYGNVARDLDESWGGQYGAELANPDFMKLADAYGVLGLRATEPTEVGRLVRRAIEKDCPALVEVPVGRMDRPRFFSPRREPLKHKP